MPKKIDVSGMRFGRLLVLSKPDIVRRGRRHVECQCDCGNIVFVEPRVLRAGHATSCGCYHREVVSAICANRLKHGHARQNDSPEYVAWIHMKSRCYRERDSKFHLYGGRGISVCERWLNDFSAFLADMGPRPSPRHSIDRIDVNGDYCSANCRWATPKQQSRNKTRHRLVEIDGKTMCLAEACERTGVNYRSALWRLNNGLNWLPPPPRTERAG